MEQDQGEVNREEEEQDEEINEGGRRNKCWRNKVEVLLKILELIPTEHNHR